MSTTNTILSQDPFSRVERQIAATLFLHGNLSGLVMYDNRITFAGTDPSPIKENPSSSDLPELCIVPDGGSMRPVDRGMISSTTFGIVQRYRIGVVTDEEQTAVADGGMNLIKWRVFQAIARMEDQSVAECVMGLPEARRFVAGDFVDALAADQMPAAYGRVIEGWAFAVTAEVLLVFPRTEVLA